MPAKKGSKAKKSDDKDIEDRAQKDKEIEPTTGALKALSDRGLSKDPPPVKQRKTKNSNRGTDVDTGSPLTTTTHLETPPAPPSPALSPVQEEPNVNFDGGNHSNQDDDGAKGNNGANDDDESNEEHKDDSDNESEGVLVQLDLIDLEDSNKAHESVMAIIDETSLGRGRTIHIQELLSKTEAVPPMTARTGVLYRNAPVGDAKVALGSVSEVLAGKAPLLRIEQLSKLELEDKNGVYYAKLWYKSDSGGHPAPATATASTQQDHQAHSQEDTTSTANPRDGFNQSKLSTEVLDWLAIELEAPSEPTHGAATLLEAWNREKTYRRVKSNAERKFKYKQAYRINKGPHSGILFRADALQDICFIKHTICSSSTTGFANAEKDPEMARWLAGEAEDDDVDFSSWSINKFWTEAKRRRSEPSTKPTTLHGKGSKPEKMLRQALKDKKRKAKDQGTKKDHDKKAKKKRSSTRVESEEEEEEEVESLNTDDMDDSA